jgi:nucleotide-binding universal stress UspA family protein
MAPPVLARITVAVDGSHGAGLALDFACDLARRYESALTILSVAPLPMYLSSTEPWVPGDVPESEVRYFQELVAKAETRARAGGLDRVRSVLLEGNAVDEIVSYVEKEPTDLLVVGSRGLSAAKRLLLGSISDALVHHVKCPVLIVREPAPPAPGRAS